jgi:steroid delta-isomerase-like uncharacterized protein
VPSTQAKEIVRRYLSEVVSGGRLDLADALVAQDLVFASPYTPEPTRDRETFKQMIAGIHAAFPDFFLTELDVVGEGELVASRWVAGGTHTGAAFGPLPATGRSFEITGMSIYRVRDGRIVEGWVNDDTLGMATQLGMIPAPQAA